VTLHPLAEEFDLLLNCHDLLQGVGRLNLTITIKLPLTLTLGMTRRPPRIVTKEEVHSSRLQNGKEFNNIQNSGHK
jgi:hypothetical protein